MKKMKLIAALCCALVCAFTFTSCEKKSTIKYTLALSNYGGTTDVAANYEAVGKYLQEKGCLGTFVITDATTEKCDQQAKTKFEGLVKNLSTEEIDQKITGGFYFTLECSRPVNLSNPNETVSIATWKYPVLK